MIRMEFNSVELPACRHGYYFREKKDTDPIRARLFRVCAFNWSKSTTLEGVRLICEQMEPGPTDGHGRSQTCLPVPLRVMHDRSERLSRSQEGVTLHPEERCYFDVVASLIVPGVQPLLVVAVEDLAISLIAGRSVLTLALYAKNVQSERKEFVVDVDEDGDLLFYSQQAPSPAQAQ